ncbi:MAG TPA: alkaline phosphatase family protein [Elusimicrobiota bacterium]|nr:alkaline phosphatase family protein [Elusimicrobiota bacterium]
MNARRILIVGLDSVPYDVFFDTRGSRRPFIERLRRDGYGGILRSCDPPITVPAWAVMASGLPPRQLGLYGFRIRGSDPYAGFVLPSSGSIQEPCLWDYFNGNGENVWVVGVPPGYPPRSVRGHWISCFLTPSGASCTSPADFQETLEKWVGGRYRADAEFRKEDRDLTLAQVYETSNQKFKILDRIVQEDDWRFAMSVDIGPDRLHHAFWKYHDVRHPGYVKGNKYQDVLPDYYRFLDGKLGELMDRLPDDTVLMIVSDHGTKGMEGCFCVNEWLIRQGYLRLKKYPETVLPLDRCDVDWDRTTAWAWGGYYARVFVNLKGREPRGTVPAEHYDVFRVKLKGELEDVRGPRGEEWKTRAVLSEPDWKGDPPDLMVSFDALSQRAAGTVGHQRLYLTENDTGPDDSVHSPDGIFWCGYKQGGRFRKDLFRKSHDNLLVDILDVAPTVAALTGSTGRADWAGQPALLWEER